MKTLSKEQRLRKPSGPADFSCHFQAMKNLSKDSPFCYRYRLDDPSLQASIKQYGIRMPIVVSEALRPVVISGHKRLHAARSLKIKEVPVLVAGQLSPKDAFLLNLVSNWKQTCSDMDRAQALGMAAREFGFVEGELLSEIMPLLGLPQDNAMLELFLKVDTAPISLKDFIDRGQLPLRGVAWLLKCPGRDQEYFAEKIGSQMKLTSSQLLQTGEWLLDKMRGTGKSLGEFCRKFKVLEGLDVPGMDPRTKADKFFARLKRLRSPRYSEYLEGFEEKAASILRDTKAIRLEPVQGFEEPGFELHARVKTPGELELLLRKIAEKRSALNSLFEIML